MNAVSVIVEGKYPRHMRQTLYLMKNEDGGLKGRQAISFGLTPSGKGTYDQFHSLKRRIGLKADLNWAEVKDLQQMFSGAGIWDNFPVQGLRFICAELKAGDEDQRIDLLYLRNDGGLYPCELKIGGESKDSHGQLIRYIADLSYQVIDAEWLKTKIVEYLLRKKVVREQDHLIEKQSLEEYLTNNHITDRHLRLINNAGLIIDENFPPQMLQAVRYLNEHCGFSIRLLQIEAFVAEDWKPELPFYLVRIELTEIQ